jgi:L,D-transpeptidase catalytic domain
MQRERGRLDGELRTAHEMGVPASLLAPITAREAAISRGQGGASTTRQDATTYDQLYAQVLAAEQQSLPLLKQQASLEVNAFATALDARQAQGVAGADAYRAHLKQAFDDLNAATTPQAYVQVAQLALTQAQALQALGSAYQKLQDFQAVIGAAQAKGIDTSAAQADYRQDLTALRVASSPDRYPRLQQVIGGQIMQLEADRTEALPYVAAAMLGTFQSRIDLLASFGEPTTTFQHEHASLLQGFRTAKTLADYLTLTQVVNDQNAQMALPLARGQANHDLATLRALVDQAEAQNPLTAYEYADPNRGIGDVAQQVADAAYSGDPMTAYNQADAHVSQLATNLRALLDNLRDPTPSGQAHQADLQLMQLYGIMNGQVTIVSLREQAARMYDNGKLVYWSYVTTGRFERPTPPGLHYAEWKAANIMFQPSDPIGSPIRGNPTPINYAVYYADYGFFLHDGWWRTTFGPGTNLPHWDPAAFNGGSHGCINFPLSHMAWYFNWVQPGTPVVVY